MTQPLAGRTIALAEGRQLEELAQMLEKEGAATLRCPMVSMLDVPDSAPVIAWLRELIAGRFDYIILLTGEGFRHLLGFAEREGLRDAVVAAFGKTKTMTRGPKPGRALREVGLTPTLVAEAPISAGSPVSRAITRRTLPSTAACGSPKAMLATAAAVYGPTPGSSRIAS